MATLAGVGTANSAAAAGSQSAGNLVENRIVTSLRGLRGPSGASSGSHLMPPANASTPVNSEEWKAFVKVHASKGLVFDDVMLGNVNWGCGADNQKCSCTYDEAKNTIVIDGTGTSFTPTGLDFNCVFSITNSDGDFTPCSIHVDVPLSGDNSLTLDCPTSKGMPGHYEMVSSFPVEAHAIKGISTISYVMNDKP
jgi:hypothetical protein